MNDDMEDIEGFYEFMEALDDKQVSAILCVYLTSDGKVRELGGGKMDALKLIGEPAKALAEECLTMHNRPASQNWKAAERQRAVNIITSRVASADEMRLLGGEMTAQEIRTVRAFAGQFMRDILEKN
jgi:hypothetical protein